MHFLVVITQNKLVANGFLTFSPFSKMFIVGSSFRCYKHWSAINHSTIKILCNAHKNTFFCSLFDIKAVSGKRNLNMCVVFLFAFFFQGWFSPGQVFVLDEYCARYGVRGCHRHLCYLNELIEHSESGSVIDPTLLHYSFAFCASHVHGNR